MSLIPQAVIDVAEDQATKKSRRHYTATEITDWVRVRYDAYRDRMCLWRSRVCRMPPWSSGGLVLHGKRLIFLTFIS